MTFPWRIQVSWFYIKFDGERRGEQGWSCGCCVMVKWNISILCRVLFSNAIFFTFATNHARKTKPLTLVMFEASVISIHRHLKACACMIDREDRSNQVKTWIIWIYQERCSHDHWCHAAPEPHPAWVAARAETILYCTESILIVSIPDPPFPATVSNREKRKQVAHASDHWPLINCCSYVLWSALALPDINIV